MGDALDEQKLFTIVQDIKQLYEKYGYSDTTVKYNLNIDEITGHGIVTFQIVESIKVKIVKVEVVGAAAFKEKTLTGELKTTKHWMFSWITGSGVFKQEDFDGDRDRLTAYYRDHGYLDFEIKDIKIEHPTPKTMTVKFYVYEGRQYRTGSIKFSGNKAYSEADIKAGLKMVHDFQHSKANLGQHNLPMDSGDVFTPKGLSKDLEAVQDFYGTKGHIEVAQGDALRVLKVPNVDTGTMDLEFQLEEGQPSAVQKIEIHGNVRTKDKVIRRELAISPGETFDMVRVKISQKRLEGLDYFEKVDMQPEPTDPPIAGEKDLIINVKEKYTGNFTLGAGFSSVDSLVGFAEYSQANFDLFHPPYFTGGGQRLRVRISVGSQRQDYEISFIEPWFLNRKLSLGVDLYRHQLNFESPNNIYDETRTGARVSLTKTLGSDFLQGTVSYGIEDVGISLNSGFQTSGQSQSSNGIFTGQNYDNVPDAIAEEVGDHFYQRFGTSLAYDTRNSTQLPNHGQRTELTPELSVGDKTFYKLELKTSWFFPGFFKGHVIELDGRSAVAQSISGGDVPFYDRYYLGGLYSMRGFKFRNVAPRDSNYGLPKNPIPNEPVGGDSFWFGSVEYSLPILEKDGGIGLRFAMFYDIGAVSASSYSFSSSYNDNWGLGIRLNIPHLGPLRLDYGIPITHDSYNSGSGKFQFGVGFQRPF